MFIIDDQVNSKWTYFHIPYSSRLKSIIIYPSVNIMNIERNQENLNNTLISFSQFRPEKNQLKQLEIFEKLNKIVQNPIYFNMIGSSREEDLELYQKIKKKAKNLEVSLIFYYKGFELIKNAPIQLIEEKLSKAKVGIHTMVEEHFGISIIEMMVKKI
jgi:alpha-1,2-mannosyltransferase